MREDLRPYWVKKCYLKLRHWYTEYFLRPECATLGPYHTVMKPWYVQISGNNIHIGRCFTAIGEPGNRSREFLSARAHLSAAGGRRKSRFTG